MKVTLVEVKSRRRGLVSKDTQGGFGQRFEVGRSLPAKIIELLKVKHVKIPVFDMAYAASILAQHNHEVKFAFNNVERDADLTIIHGSIIDYKTELRVADKIRSNGIKVGFIGPFPSIRPKVFLKHADFVISGEPEHAIKELAMGKRLKGVVKSKPVKDLNSLPYPKWEIFPIKEYSYFPTVIKKPFLPVLSSRGCVYKCNYCPYKAYYGKWRRRSVENVIKELIYLKKRFGIKGVQFRDPLFTLDKERVESICRGIMRAKIKIEWGCETHFNLLDKELLKKMHKAGMRGLNVGIESYNTEKLKKHKRTPTKIKKQESLVKYCDRIGIRVVAFYMLGLPNETWEDGINTINHAKRLNTAAAQFFIPCPYPGTEFYTHVKDRIYAKDWEEFTAFNPTFKHDNLSRKQLLKLRERAFIEYYMRPGYAIKLLRSLFY